MGKITKFKSSNKLENRAKNVSDQIMKEYLEGNKQL